MKIDKTAPAITLASRTPANAAGWNNTNVVLTWSCSDALSGPVSGSATQTMSAEGQNQSATGACADLAGNQASNTVVGINLDRTPPGISFGTASPAPNANGWNNTNVSIPFTATDSLSGVASGSPASPALITAEGAGVTTTVTLTDIAGNTATYTSPAVKIDKTVPVLTASRAPAANASGWNNTDVTVSFTCTDALSGVASAPANQTITTEGTGLSATGTCIDRAGNSASATVGGINIDKTAPVLTGMPSSCTLWPPNHQLVLVATVAASDAVSTLNTFGVTGTSNEPDNGLGDGDQPNDVVIQGGSVQLRAERSALGNGRVYTVKATASDRAGNTSTSTATCVVPLNQNH